MSGASSRRKGHQFERDIANLLKPVFPKAARQLEFQIDQCQGIDIRGTEPFLFQCKKLKSYASVNTIGEIKCDRPLGDIPVLVTAGDREPAMVVMHFEDFLNILKRGKL